MKTIATNDYRLSVKMLLTDGVKYRMFIANMYLERAAANESQADG